MLPVPLEPDPSAGLATAVPSDCADASVLADDRTVSLPPLVIARPLPIQAREWVNAMFTEMAAATLTEPSDVEAFPPPCVSPPVLPVFWVRVVLPKDRSCWTCWSTPPDGAPGLPSPGAPAALAVESLEVFDDPSASMLTAPPAVTLRSVHAST